MKTCEQDTVWELGGVRQGGDVGGYFTDAFECY